MEWMEDRDTSHAEVVWERHREVVELNPPHCSSPLLCPTTDAHSPEAETLSGLFNLLYPLDS